MVQDDRGEQPRPHGSGLGVRENSEAMNLSEDILFYAFRYALGRMTYAVSTVADEIILHAHEIDRKTRQGDHGGYREGSSGNGHGRGNMEVGGR